MEICRAPISRLATNEGGACINIMELSDRLGGFCNTYLEERYVFFILFFTNMGNGHFNFEIPKT
jgi:hypothetical protein